MIELRNVTKRFEEKDALKNVSLNVQKGEIFTVIGPNGSGKTTILRIMAGIERPTSGKVIFRGKEVNENNVGEVRKNCTLVFQKIALFNTTVENNIVFGLKLRGLSKSEIAERTKEVLEIVKLSGCEKRWANNLSGGEQQRISIARSLALESNVLLLDEPTANLDPKNVSIVEETISRVNKERGTTIIIATHNMFQVESLAEKAALLVGGMIADIGKPTEVIEKPTDYMRSFARLENVFSGNSRINESDTSTITLDEGATVEAAVKREGKVTVFVRPEDIILSKHKIVSSARNVFKGEVREIKDLGGTLKLKVKNGEKFVVQITKRSFKEMGLNIGSNVFLTFKASSVRVV